LPETSGREHMPTSITRPTSIASTANRTTARCVELAAVFQDQLLEEPSSTRASAALRRRQLALITIARAACRECPLITVGIARPSPASRTCSPQQRPLPARRSSAAARRRRSGILGALAYRAPWIRRLHPDSQTMKRVCSLRVYIARYTLLAPLAEACAGEPAWLSTAGARLPTLTRPAARVSQEPPRVPLSSGQLSE
jgi:hypothetical protein